MLDVDVVLSNVFFSGVWSWGGGAGSAFLIGVALTGLGRSSEPLLPCVEMEVRLPTGGSGFLVTTEDLRLELGNLLTLLWERPLMLLMLEFSDELSLAGERKRVELN